MGGFLRRAAIQILALCLDYFNLDFWHSKMTKLGREWLNYGWWRHIIEEYNAVAMNYWFLTIMLVMSAVSILGAICVRHNLEHVTAGYLKILGVHNRELAKPRYLAYLCLAYFLTVVAVSFFFCLILFYV